MDIKNGYKAFNSDYTNNYGKVFLEGEVYHIDGEISFGIKGNGYHFCKRIEDTFRYINDDNKIVAEVVGFGKIVESMDEYYEYFDMYSASSIKIKRFLSRDEVFNYILHANEFVVKRFIVTGFKLTDGEIAMLRNYFYNSNAICDYIDYYYLNKRDVFEDKVKKMVLK